MFAALRIFCRIGDVRTCIYRCALSFFDINERQCIWLVFRYADVFIIQCCGRRIACELCRTFTCTGPDTVTVCKRRIHFIRTGLGGFQNDLTAAYFVRTSAVIDNQCAVLCCIQCHFGTGKIKDTVLVSNHRIIAVGELHSTTF